MDGPYWSYGQSPKSVRACDTATQCGPCADAEQVYRTTLASAVAEFKLDGYFGIDELVQCAAMLRVADAMDIGAHRVSRRVALGQESAESFWHGYATSDLRHELLRAARLAQALERKSVATQLLALAAQAAKVSRNPRAEAGRKLAHVMAETLNSWPLSDSVTGALIEPLREAQDEYERQIAFLAGQDEHRQLHSAFLGADVYELEDGSLDVVMRLPVGTLPPNAEDLLSDAAQYIWSEYLGVEQLMRSAGVTLNAVRSDREGCAIHERETIIRGMTSRP